MKRILGIAMVLGLVSAVVVMGQEVKTGKVEVIDLGKDVKLEMVLIPAGKFIMGAPKNEESWTDGETQHFVTITKPYYMGKYEVTQEQYEAVMGKNPSEEKGAKLPVTDVSWVDCQECIKKLNTYTAGGFRLPTEAEWEYACRAGTKTPYSFGSKITPKDANYAGSKIEKPVEVGSYKSNAFGLYDMHGNVDEWCEDFRAPYPAKAVIDPKGPGQAYKNNELFSVYQNSGVLRGGSYFYNEIGARSAWRGTVNYNNRVARYKFNGFRLARTK